MARYRARIRRFCVETGLGNLPTSGIVVLAAFLAVTIIVAATLIGLTIGGLRHTETQQVAIFIVAANVLAVPWIFGKLGVEEVTSVVLDSTSRMILRTPTSFSGVVIPTVVLPAVIGATMSGLLLGWIMALAMQLSAVGAIMSILSTTAYATAVIALRFFSLTRWAPTATRLAGSRFSLLLAASCLILAAAVAASIPLVVVDEVLPHWSTVLSALTDSAPAFFESPIAAAPIVILVLFALSGFHLSLRPSQLSGLSNAAARLRRPVHRHQRPTNPATNVLTLLPVLKFKNDSVLLRLRGFTYILSLLTLGVLMLSTTLVLTTDSSTIATQAMRALLTVTSAVLLAEGITDASKQYFSMDSDGPAAQAIRRIPQAWRSLLQVRVRYFSLILAVSSTGLLVLLLATPLRPFIPFAATGLILGIISISAVIELPVATALFPRFDWTNINQIADHPKANVLGIGASVLAGIVAALLGLGIQAYENTWWQNQPVVSCAIGIGFIWLATLITWPTARLTLRGLRHVAS